MTTLLGDGQQARLDRTALKASQSQAQTLGDCLGQGLPSQSRDLSGESVSLWTLDAQSHVPFYERQSGVHTTVNRGRPPGPRLRTVASCQGRSTSSVADRFEVYLWTSPLRSPHAVAQTTGSVCAPPGQARASPGYRLNSRIVVATARTWATSCVRSRPVPARIAHTAKKPSAVRN